MVDNDTFFLDMYAMKFLQNDFTVHAAHTAERAFSIIEGGFEPDIMLLDIEMPGIDGLELLAVLREEKKIRKTTVIALADHGLSHHIPKAKELNVHAYIIKAMTIPSDLLKEVDKIYSQTKKEMRK